MEFSLINKNVHSLTCIEFMCNTVWFSRLNCVQIQVQPVLAVWICTNYLMSYHIALVSLYKRYHTRYSVKHTYIHIQSIECTIQQIFAKLIFLREFKFGLRYSSLIFQFFLITKWHIFVK